MSEEGKKKPTGKSGDKKPGLSPEIKKLFDAVYQHHDALEKQLDEVIGKLGMSVEQMKDYLNNPNNFPGDEWKNVQERLARVENQLKINLDTPAKPKKKAAKAQTAEEKKAEQKRKGKTLGARRNWISM